MLYCYYTFNLARGWHLHVYLQMMRAFFPYKSFRRQSWIAITFSPIFSSTTTTRNYDDKSYCHVIISITTIIIIFELSSSLLDVPIICSYKYDRACTNNAFYLTTYLWWFHMVCTYTRLNTHTCAHLNHTGRRWRF
jgi:hypothetical protein